MKLIGSYTSPFVRKISVILCEKGITFEFINEQPYDTKNNIAKYNPLGKVPILVTDTGDVWFDSPIIAEYIESLDIAPNILPYDPKEALKMKQIEAIADGITDATLILVREHARPSVQQSEEEILRQKEKIFRTLDKCESLIIDGNIKTNSLDLATISIACAIGYLKFRYASLDWCTGRPMLKTLAKNLFARESFINTTPPKL